MQRLCSGWLLLTLQFSAASLHHVLIPSHNHPPRPQPLLPTPITPPSPQPGYPSPTPFRVGVSLPLPALHTFVLWSDAANYFMIGPSKQKRSSLFFCPFSPYHFTPPQNFAVGLLCNRSLPINSSGARHLDSEEQQSPAEAPLSRDVTIFPLSTESLEDIFCFPFSSLRFFFFLFSRSYHYCRRIGLSCIDR